MAELVNFRTVTNPNIRVANSSKVLRLSRESILKTKAGNLVVLVNRSRRVEQWV